MWKALKFCIIAAIILGIAWWVASLPGNVTANAGPYSITSSAPVVILAVAAIVVLLMIFFRVLGGLRRSPAQIAAWRQTRRMQSGNIAVQRGLVAVSAGDASGAKASALKARSLLGDEPLVQWLSAEAARLSGESEQARAAFERLTQSAEMKFLGHQGLLRAHLDAGHTEEAAQQAAAAEAAYPGGTWTRQQRLTLALRGHDYAAALRLTQAPNERAALALAAAQESATPKQALDYAKQAMKAEPNNQVAIAALATAQRNAGKLRASRKTLLQGWKMAPHPVLASAWLAPISSKLERAQAAAQLAATNPYHVESELLLAQASLDADLTGEAKRHAEAALKAGNADGRAAAILAKLDGKPAPALPPGWRCTACHTKEMAWTPLCPACGKPGTLVAFSPSTALVTAEG